MLQIPIIFSMLFLDKNALSIWIWWWQLAKPKTYKKLLIRMIWSQLSPGSPRKLSLFCLIFQDQWVVNFSTKPILKELEQSNCSLKPLLTEPLPITLNMLSPSYSLIIKSKFNAISHKPSMTSIGSSHKPIPEGQPNYMTPSSRVLISLLPSKKDTLNVF